MEWYFRYIDNEGSVETVVNVVDDKMSVIVDGNQLIGGSFDLLEIESNDEAVRDRFTLSDNVICDCKIECKIPILFCKVDKCEPKELVMVLTLGKPLLNGFLDKEECKLSIEYDSKSYMSSGRSGLFEDEMTELIRKLPEGINIQCCLTCQYSDYSPYGQGLFGTMMCYRNMKEEYMAVDSKDAFLVIHDDYEQMVQETYHCSEYQKRRPNTGYRG